MNTQLIAFVIGGASLALSGGLAAGEVYRDKAKVTNVQPIVEVVEIARPEERCWDERVRHPGRPRSYTGTIAGGIVGGVVGNQFGRGSGKDIMTVAGALLGGSIGHDVSRRRAASYVSTERRCEVVEQFDREEQVVGYHVTYRYKGNTFTTRTRHDPGKWLRVRVAVEPIERY